MVSCTAASKELWFKITHAPDDPIHSPPTARHAHHPFLAMLPRRRATPDDIQRILCMLVANVNSGNLTAVARDWSYLPPQAHRLGVEALLQTALFAGFPKCFNALATVYQTGVSNDAIDWDEEDTMAMRNRDTDPRLYVFTYLSYRDTYNNRFLRTLRQVSSCRHTNISCL